MAKGIVSDPQYVTKLTAALKKTLKGAKIDHEQVRRDRYRFIVIWKKFEDMFHPERQRLVWDVADRVLAKDDIWKASMIITMAPSEVPKD
jgi:hypothetical protein